MSTSSEEVTAMGLFRSSESVIRFMPWFGVLVLVGIVGSIFFPFEEKEKGRKKAVPDKIEKAGPKN